MVKQSNDAASTEALASIRKLIAEGTWSLDGRLPPERELATRLGLPRAALRKALSVLEAEGQVWRHVGKGTFVGVRHATQAGDLATLAYRTSPAEVMHTRLLLEPIAAHLAAAHASLQQIETLRRCLSGARAARTFQQYVVWDNTLHSTISESTGNALLAGFLEALHAIRRTVVWGRLRDKAPPRPDNPSLDEHDRIVEAIAARDGERARQEMERHLARVEAELLPKPYWS